MSENPNSEKKERIETSIMFNTLDNGNRINSSSPEKTIKAKEYFKLLQRVVASNSHGLILTVQGDVGTGMSMTSLLAIRSLKRFQCCQK